MVVDAKDRRSIGNHAEIRVHDARAGVLRARSYTSPGGPTAGFRSESTAKTVAEWVESVAMREGASVEHVAAHLARTYVADSQERDARKSGQAWEKGLPLDWISQCLERAAATFAAPRRRSLIPDDAPQVEPAPLADVRGSVASLLAAVGAP